MTLPRAFAVALLLAAGLGAAPAWAGVRLVAREEPVASSSAHARRAPLRFDMVGLHWRGPGTVSFRTRSVTGVWSAWRPARPEAEDLPDRATSEAKARPGWKLGNPYWTGPADAIEYRLAGEVTRLRAFFIWSEPDAAPISTAARTTRPTIISRAQWGADESIVRAPPAYAERVRFAVVHHTAGTNSYSASESAAIVRGIQRYHVLANGWNDIGYNFLLDKYGQIFEGRGGGIRDPVIGAHAQGFNTGSTGVSVLGTYSSVGISKSARSALVRLLAWRLDVAHVDPASRLTWISAGNPEYPSGTAVRLHAIAAHRDTGPTTCPGGSFYAQLPTIRAAVAAKGLPKLYDPALAGSLGGPVRVTGRLSTTLPWTVTIRDAEGTRVAGGSGAGTRVDWTWDASAVPFGTFTYTISAPDVRPWTDDVPGPPPLFVRRVTAKPMALTPNGDGSGETTTISFSLTTAATVTVDVEDESGGLVRRLASNRALPSGTSRFVWDGRDSGGDLVSDGRYGVEVRAASPGQSASGTGAVVVDRTLGHLAVSPYRFSPNGDGRRETATASFELTRAAKVLVRVMHGDRRVVTLAGATLAAGSYSYRWDGRNRFGKRVGDGGYLVRVDATTFLGTRALSRRVRVDTTRPVARILSAVAGRRTHVTVRVNEPGVLRVWFGPVTWRDGVVVTLDVRAGKTVVTRNRVYRRVRVVAWDRAENRSADDRAWVSRL